MAVGMYMNNRLNMGSSFRCVKSKMLGCIPSGPMLIISCNLEKDFFELASGSMHVYQHWLNMKLSYLSFRPCNI